LGNILKRQGKLGSETKDLLERSLAIYKRHFGPNAINTADAHISLGKYYLQLANLRPFIILTRKEHLHQSELKYKEAVLIYTKIYGHDNPKTVEILRTLSRFPRVLSEA
jgi:hypothetical protein